MQFSNFKTYVKLDFKRTDKDTELAQAYNDMVFWLATLMPIGNYKYQSYISTIAGQEDYPVDQVGAMIHLIKPLRLLDGSASSDSGTILIDITKAEYDILEPNPNRTNPSTGRPQKACIYSRQILLWPIPDKSTYLIEKNWSIRPTIQSADADVTLLGVEWDEVLKWGTMERLFAGMEMYDESAFWGSKYHDSYGNPIGICKTLLDIEKDREGKWIGQIKNNNL